MTPNEIGQLAKDVWPIAVALIVQVAAYVQMRTSYGLRIEALEKELSKTQASMKEQNLTMWAKFDAMNSQISQILQSVVEVKTLLGVLKEKE